MSGPRPSGPQPTGPRLLLVEDDASTRELIASNLRAHGYAVDEASDVGSAALAWDAGRPDLVILDLGLPDRDGDVLVRRIRRDATTPILVVSARSEERDKVAALDSGADDFVTKPIGLAELRARIVALLRRAAGPASGTDGALVAGPVRLDLVRRRVTVGDAPVELTPREYELLKALLAEPDRVVTKGRLLRAVWGTAYADEGHYLHVYVSRLRAKLGAADPSGTAGRLIAAIPGVGYRVSPDT